MNEFNFIGLIPNFQIVLAILIGFSLLIVLLFILGETLLVWYRNRNREERSLKFVLLQVAVPRDNEIKIDAA